MAATIEPAPGSRRLQHFIWAVGEARISRVDGDAGDGLDGALGPDAGLFVTLPDVMTHPPDVPVTQARGVPPDVDGADFFTEWQPPGPA